jgi:hypothetical protein
MVRIMRLGDDVGDRQLELDQMEIGLRIAASQIVAVGQPGEDMCHLRDGDFTLAVFGDEIGRGIGCEIAALLARFHILDQRLRIGLPRPVAIGEMPAASMNSRTNSPRPWMPGQYHRS